MRTDKIRKYLIPNIPYLFILWAFLKLGTAYRLAAGNDFAHKLIGLGQTIGPAFADFAPGLAPLDWLKGVPPSLPPKGSRCDGCPYWRGIGCVFCYREQLKPPGNGR